MKFTRQKYLEYRNLTFRQFLEEYHGFKWVPAEQGAITKYIRKFKLDLPKDFRSLYSFNRCLYLVAYNPEEMDNIHVVKLNRIEGEK